MPVNPNNKVLWDDGMIVWFNGPEWDQVAADHFATAELQLEQSAKDNAPWADRTGDARRGITAKSSHSNGDITMTLFHTVDYGLWLEVIQNGAFATIMPTIERDGPRLIYNAIRRIRHARKGQNR